MLAQCIQGRQGGLSTGEAGVEPAVNRRQTVKQGTQNGGLNGLTTDRIEVSNV